MAFKRRFYHPQWHTPDRLYKDPATYTLEEKAEMDRICRVYHWRLRRYERQQAEILECEYAAYLETERVERAEDEWASLRLPYVVLP